MEDANVFVTDRLLVRRWVPSDQAKVYQLYCHPDVVRWVDDGNPITETEAQSWMHVTQANYEKRGYGMFAIDARDTGETLGFGGLVHPANQPDPEVKYALQRAVWGKGLATEFVTGLLQYARHVHGIGRVLATVAAENTASQNVLSKAGFTIEMRRTEDDGRQTDVFVLRD